MERLAKYQRYLVARTLAAVLQGVPITIGTVIATDHFARTRWIARMLAEEPKSAK